MNLEELRSLKKNLEKAAKEEKKTPPPTNQPVFDQRAILNELATKKRKKASVKKARRRSFTGTTKLLGFITLSTVVILTSTFIYKRISRERVYKPSIHKLDTTNCKERNALDFARSIVPYGTREATLRNFLDKDFSNRSIDSALTFFVALKKAEFDVETLEEDAAKENSFVILYSTSKFSGKMSLVLNDKSQFKIKYLEQWR